MSKAPLIYAELLLNIRQISIIVALDTPCDATTNVELSKDGGKFILDHKGTTTPLELPGRVTYSSQLQRPTIGSKELSWRLPLSGQPIRVDDVQNNEAPWSAASLTENDEFSCRDCGAVVVKREVVKTWKDLPSENWAEMMDFWHCHKPDVPHTDGSSDQPPAPDKGYGANTKFSANVGVGFVDLTTILLSDSDCTCIQVRALLLLFCDYEMGIKKVAIFCASCSVVWPPIQIPNMNTLFLSYNSQLAYPLLRTMGSLLTKGKSSRHTLYLPDIWKAVDFKQWTFRGGAIMCCFYYQITYNQDH
jgi:hypothetical protein